MCILSAVLEKGKMTLSEVKGKEWKTNLNGISSYFRGDKWIPPFLNRGSGVSESWGRLVFHMALLNSEDLAKWCLKGRFHPSFTLPNRASNQCG